MSITTWVPSGVVRPISWMKSEANSTSRQMRLCFANSAQNQRKPNFDATGAPSPAAGSAAASRWIKMTPGSNKFFSDATGAVCGVWSPATK